MSSKTKAKNTWGLVRMDETSKLYMELKKKKNKTNHGLLEERLEKMNTDNINPQHYQQGKISNRLYTRPEDELPDCISMQVPLPMGT